eukprot:TRINITY_DN68020_c1_g4_i1.p1 TRINITY_DN68020_c1_g4~~TRINITY_DN68020_c1_g4_i1.p1  ORF type:complete len:212 (-),score=14.97 TRINITY_DN68020_c1_g4_i1:256-891(-)
MLTHWMEKEQKSILNQFISSRSAVHKATTERIAREAAEAEEKAVDDALNAEMAARSNYHLLQFLNKEAQDSMWAEDEQLHYWSKDTPEDVGKGKLDMSMMKSRHDAEHRRSELALLRRKMSETSKGIFQPNAYYRLTIVREDGWQMGYKIRYDTLLFKVMDHFVQSTHDQFAKHEFTATLNGKEIWLDPAKSGVHYQLPDGVEIRAIMLVV